MTFQIAASLDDFWEGEMRGVVIDGCPVLLVHTRDGVAAFADRCPHQGVPLSQGRFDGVEIVCAAHEWRYEARSGHGINPVNARLTPLPIRVEGSDIYIDTRRGAGDRR